MNSNNGRDEAQSIYMTAQVSSIMEFRKELQSNNENIISFEDAVKIWIEQGYAERFRIAYDGGQTIREPAKA